MGIIDRAIEAFSPEKAERRMDARVRLDLKRKYLNKGYDQHGASTSKKSMRGWRTQSGDPDDDITKNLPKLRERSRDLWMGVPLATGALRAIRTSVVGAGLRLNSQIRADLLGLTPEQKRAWERRAEDLWAYWAGSNECDVRRIHDFGMLQGLALLSMLMNGDAFAVLPMVDATQSLISLRVRLI
jgi:capsid protein